MLRVGVTGGIGSGKSTVARLLGELGAVVIDADQVAREVVEPGQPALAAIQGRFGDRVIRSDGTLDRAGLAAIVFPDRAELAALEAITGPAISARVAARRAAVGHDDVTVFDMPLLVEHRLWVHEHLTVVVGADVETRVQRLVARGLGERDARARIATQATDADRRAAADVWIDNNGTPDALTARVDALWNERIVPFNENVLGGIRSRRPELGAVVEPREDWPARADRLVAKLEAALDPLGTVTDIEHIGSTAVPGLLAKDVIDLQIGVRQLSDADSDAFRAAMRDAGYAESPGNTQDSPHPPGSDPEPWTKRFHGSCDPEEIVHVHVRARDSKGWELALLFRDWLRAVPAEREAYAAEKRRLLDLDPRTSAYVEAKEPWFAKAHGRAQDWASRTAWRPRPGSSGTRRS